MAENVKVITNNKKAFFEYFLSDFLEVGIELKGTEIKSLKENGCSLNDSYVLIKNGEAYILGMNIAVYRNGNIFNHEPLRTRKLLLHKKEILKFQQKIQEKGFTVVCTKVYLKEGKAKLEVALAKGKKLFDKRETIKERDQKREASKAVMY
ncbi:MAG: SsrA-binding protein SmpB [Bacillales bacterium]|nr:SsrA-binding protein SmpB [Bacillales bacterium]